MYTGRLESADSVVGLAMSATGDVDTYVCGMGTTFATNSRWFIGSLASGKASLQTDGVRLDLTMRGDMADVALTGADGIVHSTVIERAAGSHSALYESDAEATCRWGVVVLDDGEAEPEIHGTWCDALTPTNLDPPDAPTAIYAQVTPVKPINFSKDILPVLVTTPEGVERFDVHRARVSRSTP